MYFRESENVAIGMSLNQGRLVQVFIYFMPIINQGKASFSSFGASGECTISISPLLLLRICSLHAFSYST